MEYSPGIAIWSGPGPVRFEIRQSTHQSNATCCVVQILVMAYFALSRMRERLEPASDVRAQQVCSKGGGGRMMRVTCTHRSRARISNQSPAWGKPKRKRTRSYSINGSKK